MEQLYHQTNKLVHEVHNDMGRLERSAGNESNRVEQEVQAQIDHIISNCERLEILVNKEPPSRRANAKMKVDQLKYDCQHLQAAFRQIQHKRFVREQEDKEREALLTRRFTANDETSIQVDADLQHNTRLHDSHRYMDDLISSGSSILSNLRDQRGTLKGVHRKILEVANTLGLSNTVMRLIERRTAQDKIIFWAGVVITCVIMYLVWAYFS